MAKSKVKQTARKQKLQLKETKKSPGKLSKGCTLNKVVCRKGIKLISFSLLCCPCMWPAPVSCMCELKNNFTSHH